MLQALSCLTLPIPSKAKSLLSHTHHLGDPVISSLISGHSPPHPPCQPQQMPPFFSHILQTSGPVGSSCCLSSPDGALFPENLLLFLKTQHIPSCPEAARL